MNPFISLQNTFDPKPFSIYMLSLLFLMQFAACSNENESVVENEPAEQLSEEEEVQKPGIGTILNAIIIGLIAANGGQDANLVVALIESKDKTYWGNPITSKAMIDEVKAMGFSTLRIPITWGPNQVEISPYTIDPYYLTEIKRVVDFGFQNKMHVIIDVHHDNSWIKPMASETQKYFVKSGILNLNFSGVTALQMDIKIEGITEEWSGGNSEGRGYINDFHKAAVDAIRATGGNNEKRHIMITTWAASTVPIAMEELTIPNDDEKIIISLHSYFPWQFAGEAAVTWGSESDKSALIAELDKIKQKWIIERDRPVILGEWGTIEANPLQSRINYADFYAKEAAARGLLTIVWDDGGNFRLFNRNDLSWDFADIATAIVAASQ